MKKILNILLITILFIPIMVNAEECETSKVYIDSISIDNAKGNVIELEDASAKDKKVNLNLRMATKDDEILYKIVLKNDSNEDYEINKNSINLNTDYLEYSLESDNNNIVKANSTRTVYLRVKYAKTVDQSKFVNGVYQDNITMRVNLRTEDTPANPKTGLPYLIIISIILLVSGIALIVYKKKKLSTLMILVGIILLPIGVKALCTCEIVVDSKVAIKIEDEGRTIIHDCDDDYDYTFKYRIGMTGNEYLDSTYFTSLNPTIQEELVYYLQSNKYKKYTIDNEFFDCLGQIVKPKPSDYQNEEEYYQALEIATNARDACYRDHSKQFNFNDKVISKDEGALYIERFTSCGGTVITGA